MNVLIIVILILKRHFKSEKTKLSLLIISSKVSEELQVTTIYFKDENRLVIF